MKKKLFILLTMLAALLPMSSWAQGVAGDSTAVAAPTFRFEGDNLIIETETAGASIFYQMAELSNMDEATIEKISSDMMVTADGQQSIYYQQPIVITKSVIIKALAAGATVSEVSTLVYDYDSWQDLLKAVEYGADVYDRAQGNEKVDSTSLADLVWMLDEGKMIYDRRADMDSYEAQHFSERIMEMARQIEEMMGSDVPVMDVSFDDNGVLWVEGDVSMWQVMEEASKMHNVAEHITAIVWNSSMPLTNSDLQGLDNPNMLIYVAADSLAPANRDNVVIGDLAKNVVLTDVASGNGSFYCPREFKAEMISYTHEYKQTTEVGVSRGWETIALPFDVQNIVHENMGLIAPFGNSTSEKHFWLRQLTQQGLSQATTIQANWPYLISMPNSESYPAAYNLAGRVTFSSQDAIVPVTQPYDMETYNENGEMVMMRATFFGVSNTAEVYALNVGEARGSYPEGSVFEANYREIRPFEAYTVHHGNGPAPRFISIADFNNGGTTGIEDVRGLMSDGRGGVWYDLQGRKIVNGKSVNGKLPRGIYLSNGRKMIVR